MKDKEIVIVVYSHPEYYPPTLNMIREFSILSSGIVVLCRNVFDSDWSYPDNIKIISTGQKMTIRESENRSKIMKFYSFLLFTMRLLLVLNNRKIGYVVLCDPIPTLSYWLVKRFIFYRQKLWYHNHDVVENQYNRKFSLLWFSVKTQNSLFKNFDIFTLPAMERLIYFPLNNFRGRFYFLPNYPSLKFIKDLPISHVSSTEIRLLFQGSLGSGHGLEEIITILNRRVNGKKLMLILKGFYSPAYCEDLISIAEKNNVQSQIEFFGVTGYRGVFDLGSNCHIGLAIHKGGDIMNRSLGTSSNKIYEYAAMGLPVILYNNAHFKEHLSSFNWCFFSDSSAENLLELIQIIDDNYQSYHDSALSSIQTKLNFELYFSKIDL